MVTGLYAGSEGWRDYMSTYTLTSPEILYGTNMGNSNQHLHYDVPHVLVGKLNGKMKGNRHLAYPTKQVPTGNLLLSILDKFDIHLESIGDSTGRLENL